MHLQDVASNTSFDMHYQFGQPKTYLALLEVVRLTLLRSKLGDTRTERAAEEIGNCPQLPRLNTFPDRATERR